MGAWTFPGVRGLCGPGCSHACTEQGNREVSMSEYTIKDRVAIIGVGETKYYKRGQAPVPEFRLACEAIINAAEDAGIDVREIDGVSGYADDRNDASRLAT